MKILMISSCLLIASLLTSAAAELQPGDWSGSYTFKDDKLRAKYVVTQEDKEGGVSLAISMHVAGRVFTFDPIELSDDQLRFQMNPGEEVVCLLLATEDGTYKGECHSLADPEETETIKMFMRPPQADAAAHQAEN